MALHDARGRYLTAHEFRGTRTAIRLRYRRLVSLALTHGAERMLLVHNHPSGNQAPSEQDISATAGLAAVCAPLDLVLHDHLIVAGDRVTSMRLAGYLPRLEGFHR